MNTTTTVWPAGDVVAPAMDRPTALRLAATEYHRVAEAVADLRPDEWRLPTDCSDWDVHALVAHVAGMARAAANPLEMARQLVLAQRHRRHGQELVDAQTALQVAERAHRVAAGLVAEVRSVGPRAARGRRRTPGPLRRLRLPEPQQVNGVAETWSIGFLTDVILTRDTWMHRLDLARATGRPPVLTPDHDGVLVDDVVREWARRHGRAYRLTLTGPAGGSWSSGPGGQAGDPGAEETVLDAADFCRALSGRRVDGVPAASLLGAQVPF